MSGCFKQFLIENPDVVKAIKRDPIYKQRQITKINFRKRLMEYAEKANSKVTEK